MTEFNDDYGLIVEDYFPYQTLQSINTNIQRLIDTRNDLLCKVKRLLNEGSCYGNIVEEYRKVNNKEYGPYYRLTFYTDDTGHKEKPRYVSADQVDEIRQQINNYYRLQSLQKEVNDLESNLKQARRHIENLDSFLTGCARDYQQLVIPALSPPAASNTKKE